MVTARWNRALLAESNDTIIVDGNHYFPRNSLNLEYFAKSEAQTRCPSKGTAKYFDVVVDGKINPGAAWYYPDPKPAAAEIRDRVAFWRGVDVR
jgi:uncharacterized protein (DUF427 family)